jgi:hypothetical protein
MPVPRFAVIPLVLIAAALVWVAANPGGAAIGPTEPATTPTPSPLATLTSPAAPTPDVPGPLPDGLTGRLTYRTGRELVTVRFPDLATSIAAPERTWVGEPSADGEWRVHFGCGDVDCVNLYSGYHPASTVFASLYAHEWSPSGHTLAIITSIEGEYLYGQRIEVIDDPGAPSPRTLFEFEHGAAGISALRWTHRGSIVFAYEQNGVAELREVALDGRTRTLASGLAPVPHLYASPDRSRLAFTQESDAGWRLAVFDFDDGTVRDLGNMGSDPAGVAPPQPAPPDTGKGPIYVAWSPDGSRLAFGGGTQPPYTMTTVDVVNGAVARTQFPSGYPGEIRWSADGSMVAVSTYDVARTHHETWVVDPASGSGRHLMDGCVIVWSPDGRYLAVHGEDRPGVAIVDVHTGARGQLTHRPDDVPLEWTL